MKRKQGLSTAQMASLREKGLKRVELGIGVGASGTSPFASATVQPQQSGGKGLRPSPSASSVGTAPKAQGTEK